MLSYLQLKNTHLKPNTLQSSVATFYLFLLGIGLGILSKFLDELPRGTLPFFLDILEVDRFLSRMPVWLVSALAITLFSKSPVKGAINVFLFYSSMISSYYWYSATFLGIFPYHKVRYWTILTLISPLIAYFCWYARKNNWFGNFLSIGIIATLFFYTFIKNMPFLDASSILDIITFILCLILIKRSFSKMIYLLFLGVLFSFAFSFFLST